MSVLQEHGAAFLPWKEWSESIAIGDDSLVKNQIEVYPFPEIVSETHIGDHDISGTVILNEGDGRYFGVEHEFGPYPGDLQGHLLLAVRKRDEVDMRIVATQLQVPGSNPGRFKNHTHFPTIIKGPCLETDIQAGRPAGGRFQAGS